MFGLQSVLGTSQKPDPRQDSSSSSISKFSVDSKTSELSGRSSSTLAFLSRSKHSLTLRCILLRSSWFQRMSYSHHWPDAQLTQCQISLLRMLQAVRCHYTFISVVSCMLQQLHEYKPDSSPLVLTNAYSGETYHPVVLLRMTTALMLLLCCR